MLVKWDGHNDLVNSIGLCLSGVTAQTRPPDGGVINRDAAGEPTGRFEDSVVALVEHLLPAPGFDEQVEDMRLASAGYVRPQWLCSMSFDQASCGTAPA